MYVLLSVNSPNRETLKMLRKQTLSASHRTHPNHHTTPLRSTGLKLNRSLPDLLSFCPNTVHLFQQTHLVTKHWQNILQQKGHRNFRRTMTFSSEQEYFFAPILTNLKALNIASVLRSISHEMLHSSRSSIFYHSSSNYHGSDRIQIEDSTTGNLTTPD